MFSQIRIALLVITAASLCTISTASPACHTDPADQAPTAAQVQTDIKKSDSEAMAKAMECCRVKCGMKNEDIDPENPCRMCADHKRGSAAVALPRSSDEAGSCSQACIRTDGGGTPAQAPLPATTRATNPKASLDRWLLGDEGRTRLMFMVPVFSPTKDPALDLPDPPPKAF